MVSLTMFLAVIKLKSKPGFRFIGGAMSLDEFLHKMDLMIKKLEEMSSKLEPAARYNLVYKTVYNRRGTPYRYLYLIRYDEWGRSCYIGKVDDPRLDELLTQHLKFRTIVRRIEDVLRMLSELRKQYERMLTEVKMMADLYDYLVKAVKEGKIDGSREQVQIAIRLLKPFKELVGGADGSA